MCIRDRQIAERLAGLRDALEIAPEEIAKVCNLTTEQYLELESGNVDISVSVLHQISQAYGVEPVSYTHLCCQTHEQLLKTQNKLLYEYLRLTPKNRSAYFLKKIHTVRRKQKTSAESYKNTSGKQ